MKRMMLRVAGLVVLFGALSVATAHADTRFSFHVGVGVPVAVAPAPYPYGAYAAPSPYARYAAPYPGYVWQPGYHIGYRWRPGAWVPRGRVLVAPRYDRRWDRDRRRW
jgi:hypothetical protein